ncbi:hypothetical protein TVAG_227140 [Trichomonas vaginalis G3]|uniref:Uncharacterized protein n=1 Tax=Trichomonas vaginalis (strain ATCC PRA-98 / G3) TaxID=412133 RepID=A2FFV8_TRIV3|nr:protein ubiquitination [Trichomonas vaginalis G3]EAX96219.1 hypothetical protein TVAG_227140 [Trichomonas vaginalis G3]KAI5496648.1 protein ubiquitination [Trichomonas vaginalis G3]|eukprot:XP_001309149.1 hypothetical protein [Trichomonas vaginalis G3]
MKASLEERLNFESLGAKEIHYLCATDNHSRLNEYLSSFPDDVKEDILMERDYYGNTGLHYAAMTSSYLVTDYMLTFFYNDKLQNLDGVTPLHIAAKIGDMDMLQGLNKNQTIAKVKSNMGWLPIHYAVFNNQIKAVEFFIKEYPSCINACITKMDPSFSTFHLSKWSFTSPLDMAKLRGFSALEKLLEDHNALSSLHACCATHNLLGVSYYLSTEKSKKALLNSTAAPFECTPLHIAASLGDAQICHCLVNSGAKCDMLDSHGFFPLEAAVVSQSRMTVRVILSASNRNAIIGAAFLAASLKNEDILIDLISDFLLNEIDYKRDSLLICAIKNKFSKAARKLIEIGADISYKNSSGATALHIAAALNLVEIVILIGQKGGVNDLDNYGRTPLMYATLNLSRDSFFALVQLNADINTVDKFGMPVFPLSIAQGLRIISASPEMYHGRYTIRLRDFLESFRSEEYVCKVTPYGIPENIKEHKTKFSIINDTVYESLKGPSKIIPILEEITILHAITVFTTNVQHLQHALSPARHLTDTPDKRGRNPIHMAALVSNEACLEFLLRSNANVRAVDNDGNNVLHLMQNDKMAPLVNYIYENFSLPTIIQNKNGDLPIHIACRNKAMELLKALCNNSKMSEYLSLRNNDGETAVDCAVKSGAINCMNFLYVCGVQNPLIQAVIERDKNAVNKLLEDGVSIDSADINQMSPLHHAAAMGDLEMIKLLLEKNASVSMQSKKGWTLLHYAASKNNTEAIILIASRMKLNAWTWDYQKQAFIECQDMNCKKICFSIWKRWQLLGELAEHLSHFGDDFTLMKQTIGFYQDKCEVYPAYITFATNFEQIIKRFVHFVKEGTSSSPSLHHALSMMTNVNIVKYIESCNSNFKFFVQMNDPKNKSNFDVVKTVFILFDIFPMITLIWRYIDVLRQFLIPQLDNINLIEKIINKFKAQYNFASDFLTNMRKPILKLINFNQDTHGKPYFYAKAEATELSNASTASFCNHFNEAYLRIFNTQTPMPREIPFKQNDNLMILVHNEMIKISTNKKSFELPYNFVHIRNHRDCVVLIVTPLGSIKLTFKDPVVASEFIRAVSWRALHENPQITGISQMETEKDKLFEVLVAYQLASQRFLNIRMMNVRAHSIDACSDIVREYMFDTFSSHILSMTVSAGDIPDNYIVI